MCSFQWIDQSTGKSKHTALYFTGAFAKAYQKYKRSRKKGQKIDLVQLIYKDSDHGEITSYHNRSLLGVAGIRGTPKRRKLRISHQPQQLENIFAKGKWSRILVLYLLIIFLLRERGVVLRLLVFHNSSNPWWLKRPFCWALPAITLPKLPTEL